MKILICYFLELSEVASVGCYFVLVNLSLLSKQVCLRRATITIRLFLLGGCRRHCFTPLNKIKYQIICILAFVIMKM